MPTATLPTLSSDQIEDLLYLARTGETHSLTTTLASTAKTLSLPTATILTLAVDPTTGNSLLHMAAANGHTDTLTTLLTLGATVGLQNAAGNTALHWAALNGHLGAVQALVGAGADVGVVNGAGQDAVFAAEGSGREEVAGWLLKEGRGLERRVGGGREGEGEEGGDMVGEEGDLEGEGEEAVPAP